ETQNVSMDMYNKWNKVSITGSLSSDENVEANYLVLTFPLPYVSLRKLLVSNSSTHVDYKPAPEDQKQVIEDMKSTITRHTEEIRIANEQISLSASKKEFDELDKAVKDNYAEFLVSAEKVTTRLNEVSEDIDGKISTAKAEIITTVNGTTERYTKTEIEKVSKELNKKIDDIDFQVGGRNLLPAFTDPRWQGINPKFIKDDYTMEFPAGHSPVLRFDLELKPNTSYTYT